MSSEVLRSIQVRFYRQVLDLKKIGQEEPIKLLLKIKIFKVIFQILKFLKLTNKTQFYQDQVNTSIKVLNKQEDSWKVQVDLDLQVLIVHLKVTHFILKLNQSFQVKKN